MFDSLLQKAKSFVVEDVPEAAPLKARPTVAPQPAPVQDVDFGHQSSANVEPKVEELRTQLLPTSGPLVMFTSVLNSLQGAIPNEATRFRTAVQVLGAQGITLPLVSQEINTVLGKIEAHKNAAEEARARKYKERVTDKQVEIDKVEKQLEAKQAEIAQLILQKDTLQAEIQTSEAQIKERAWQWEAARATLSDKYNDLSKKLGIYFDNNSKATQGASK